MIDCWNFLLFKNWIDFDKYMNVGIKIDVNIVIISATMKIKKTFKLFLIAPVDI